MAAVSLIFPLPSPANKNPVTTATRTVRIDRPYMMIFPFLELAVLLCGEACGLIALSRRPTAQATFVLHLLLAVRAVVQEHLLRRRTTKALSSRIPAPGSGIVKSIPMPGL